VTVSSVIIANCKFLVKCASERSLKIGGYFDEVMKTDVLLLGTTRYFQAVVLTISLGVNSRQ